MSTVVYYRVELELPEADGEPAHASWERNKSDLASGPTACIDVCEKLAGPVLDRRAERKSESDLDEISRRGVAGLERAALGSQLLRLAVSDDRVLDRLERDLRRCEEGVIRIRVELRLGHQRLERLPWELLHMPGRGFLGLEPGVSIVRLGDTRADGVVLPEPGPIHIRYVDAGAVGGSGEGSGPTLDTEAWASDETLAGAVDRHGAIDRRHVTWEAVKAELVAAPGGPNVFHFTGHGERGGGRDVQIMFHSPEGSTDPAAGIGVASLGDRLYDAGVQLAVFAACEAGSDANWRGLGAAMLAYVPAVVSMQAEVYDGPASRFCREMYVALGCGEDLETAVARGRHRVWQLGLPDWWIPMLHCRSVLHFKEHPQISARVGRSAPSTEPTLADEDLRSGSAASRRWFDRSSQGVVVALSPDGEYCAESSRGTTRVGKIDRGVPDWRHFPAVRPDATVKAVFGRPDLRALLIGANGYASEIHLARTETGFRQVAEWPATPVSAAWTGCGFTWIDVEQNVYAGDNPWGVRPGPEARFLDVAVGGGVRLAAWTEDDELVVARAALADEGGRVGDDGELRRVKLSGIPRDIFVARPEGGLEPGAVFVRFGQTCRGWSWRDLERP